VKVEIEIKEKVNRVTKTERVEKYKSYKVIQYFIKKNIMKTFRNKYYSIFVAFTVLFYSCEIYELRTPQSFSFEHYENFKKSNLKFLDLKLVDLGNKNSKSSSNPDLVIANLNLLINQINQHFNTNLSIPDKILLGIYDNNTEEEVKSFLKQENLMSDNDIQLYENFVINSKNEGFDIAMDKFQTNIVEQNLSPLEFNKYNDIANTLKIVDDQDPLLLKIDSQGPTVGPGINGGALYIMFCG
jgi:hypothetical protein